MKTCARYVWTMAALGGLFCICGCTTSHSRRTVRTIESRQIGAQTEFAVVESSTDRELSPQEMAQLRESVKKYLESAGLMGRKGEYFVRVNFPAAKPGEPDEWVVVKLTNIPASTYTLIAAYPAIGADDYYPNDYFYDYGFSSWNSRYGYNDPASYYPSDYRWFGPTIPRQPGDHKPGNYRPGDRDNRPRGTHTRNDDRRDRNDGTPDREYRPRNTGYTPRPADTGGSRDRAPRTDYAPREHTPRPSDSGGSRDHGPRDYSPPPSSGNSGGSSYSPPPPRSEPPPSAPRYERNDAETAHTIEKDK